MDDWKPLEYEATALARDIAAAGGPTAVSVLAVLELLTDGNTVPFIARYRKERTGSLDEVALRDIEDALAMRRELLDRKNVVLKSIAEQGKLDAKLHAAIVSAGDKKELEDLYLPYKPKRRTRAADAAERGLEPLAAVLRSQKNPPQPIPALLARFVNPERGVPDAEAALRGACDIIAEEWAEDPQTRRWMRQRISRGALRCRKKRGYKGEDDRFESYYQFEEPLRRVASHRFLAMQRGEQAGVLSCGIEVDTDRTLAALEHRLVLNPQFVFSRELQRTVADSYKRLLFPSIEKEALGELKARADREAIDVFARNLSELLMAPPAGPKTVLALDPGFRSGCKVAVIDETGRFLESATVYPTPPRNDTGGAARTLRRLILRHDVEIIAIGNGTASRETDLFVTGLLSELPQKIQKALVNESGASIYSASDVARAEFPDLDVTVRGAINIARRLQDPLAELVKIDPKSIGVGQYQHDVNGKWLQQALDRVVASCVNRVGVDLNTASAPLLSYVSGIGPRLAKLVVEHRDAHGPFRTRHNLEAVPRFGAKAFLQSAGFLRIRDGSEPLDASAVHPESYYVVEKIAGKKGYTVSQLIGRPEELVGLDASCFVDEQTGLPTVQDILAELAKPGRDPRSEFRVAVFAEGIDEISDLRPGMRLEGVVTNVTHFGAFVDVGVHQDGLVHVSELDHRFVQDPNALIKVGEIVDVVVLDVDVQRKRIALSRKQALS